MINIVIIFIVIAIDIIDLKKSFAKILIFLLSIANLFAIILSKIILLNKIIIYNFNNKEKYEIFNK